MATAIKFGTSGWRAVIAEQFTFDNVRRALSGIARYVVSQKSAGARVIVGRDPRFLGETLEKLAAEVLSSHGITPLIISEPAPTPAISYEVIRSKADGAINFTASHNPPEYNGIKFSTPDGAPALPEVTKKIEAEIASLDGTGPINAKDLRVDTVRGQPVVRITHIPTGTVVTCDSESTEAKNRRRAMALLQTKLDELNAAQTIEVRPAYLARLKEIIDLPAINKANLKVAFDPLWGAARGYSDHLLRDAGIEVATVHDYRDVLFGGHAPEPDDHLLGELRRKMKDTGAHLGIATDGDADRFGIVDRDGTFIPPNYIIALLFDYLVDTRGWKNGVAKSVATTNLINALAAHHKVELHETPVGFKYIGELIKQDKIAIGGEESAGLSIRHHVPEKDGILAGLLCCEMVARRGRTISELLRELFVKVGSFYPSRENFRLTEEVKAKFTTKLQAEPREFAGRNVSAVVRTDGLKLVLGDGSWVCYRLSGTEPVVRVYAEGRTLEDLQSLSAAAKQWIFE